MTKHVQQKQFTFSIITVCYNAEATIADTILSVNSQVYDDYEHIIIDGNSSDETRKVIEKHTHERLRVISEKDGGIYDAMNKGIRLCQGSYVAILNSDDYLCDEFVLKSLVDLFSHSNADVIFSGINYVNANKEIFSQWMPKEFKKNDYAKGFHTPHPGFFVKSSLYKSEGLFDLSMRVAADFDLMHRFMEASRVKCVRLPQITVNMRDGGESASLRNIIRGYNDIKRSFQKRSVRIFAPMYFARRYAPKLGRKIKSQLSKVSFIP